MTQKAVPNGGQALCSDGLGCFLDAPGLQADIKGQFGGKFDHNRDRLLLRAYHWMRNKEYASDLKIVEHPSSRKNALCKVPCLKGRYSIFRLKNSELSWIAQEISKKEHLSSRKNAH